MSLFSLLNSIMAIHQLDFWYDRQIPRFIEQIVRAFSGFQYATGWRKGQPPTLKMVPCRVASRDRLVASIINNNSENVMQSVPMITVEHTGLSGRREALQSPTHIDTQFVVERAIDDNGKYTGERGNSYTVQRLMPLPFMLTFQIDIWTSNQDQKYQLMEQILTTMYPDFEIQNSDNALDWTAKTTFTLDDDVNWSSRSLPLGTESEIEITTLTGKVPMWLTPPAKVQQERRIEQIVANINAGNTNSAGGLDSAGDLGQIIVTPGNNWIEVKNGLITLRGPKNGADEVYSWEKLFESYGTFRAAETMLRLKKVHNIESDQEIIGTLQYDVNHPDVMHWQIDLDTLPSNTLLPLTAVIDPLSTMPGNGLPGSATGQRYLVVNDVANTSMWGTLSARTNDIIEYQNGDWVVVFNALTSQGTEFVLNSTTSKQLRWDGESWALAIDGYYAPGYWRLTI